MKEIKLATVIGLAFAASTACAAVTYDDDGMGFVGKGDVQLALGYNNAQLQINAEKLGFRYQTEDKYAATCEWNTVTGQGKIIYHDVTVHRTVTVTKSVAYSDRKNGNSTQITGFELLGWGSATQNINPPAVGGACLGGSGQQGTWTSVDSTSRTGGLYVIAPDGAAVLLPTTLI
jgi:hypothetical protein